MGIGKAVGTATNLFIQKKYPVSLIHFVTNRCNARCSFCFIDFDDSKTQKKSNEMTIDEVRLLTKNLGPSLQHVNITGGEPFLRLDLVDIVRAYFDHAELGSILINTNGAFPKQVEALTKTILQEYPGKKIFYIFSIDSFPEEHDRIRKVPGLFKKVIESYQVVKDLRPYAVPSINLTVSEQNYQVVNELYDVLRDDYGVDSMSPVIVRDEGVYRIPYEHQRAILAAYKELTEKLLSDVRSGKIGGFDTGTVRGRMVNAKNQIQYRMIGDIYLKPEFQSYCPAGSIFGVIGTDATVHPCEILSKPLGNLRDYEFDFMKLWHDTRATEVKKWVRDTKCHCHWECAWTYNILSNPQYQPQLLKYALLTPWTRHDGRDASNNDHHSKHQEQRSAV